MNSENKISVRCPTRVDLAGGTLDCWPIYLFLGDPVTVNLAIDVFTYVDLQPRQDSVIQLITDDLNATKQYANLQSCLDDKDPAFELVRAHLRYWRPEKGFELRTKSDSPVGGGLGGSSSLCISLLKAFSQWLKTPIEPYEMVRLASHLEAQILKKPTGTQDYFPPIHGGMCVIRYKVQGPVVEVRRLPKKILDGRFLLVYTGKSHNSGINNWDVIKRYLDGDERPQKALKELAQVSSRLLAAFNADDDTKLAQIFADEYRARTELSDGFSSPEIRRLQEIALKNGALAKICGAGGGGCVLIWCQNRDADKLGLVFKESGFQVMSARPWEDS